MFRLLLLGLFAAAAPCQAEPEATAARRPFLRLIENDDGGRLEALVATYRKGPAVLQLFGCVHIADRSFYEAMQRRFEDLDALLYELVGDASIRPHPDMKRGENSHWIASIQGGMGAGLKLADQFGAMDYRHDNFVHADMTEVEWRQALKAAESNELREVFSIGSTDSDRVEEAKRSEIDLVGAFRSGGGVAELRLMMARVMIGGDSASDQPTVIIHGRNEKCLSVLQQQLDLGKQRLGIFYGAAHMEHMEHRLVEDLGWERTREEWVLAWDCSKKRWPKQERGLKQKRYRARRDLKKLLKAVLEHDASFEGEVTWATLRAASPGGRLPGRSDGKDEWGRHYLLRRVEGGWQLRCVGSDGEPDTADDLVEGAGS